MTETALDPNRHAFRDDLADRRLEGRVRAARFVDGEAMRCAVGVTAIRGSPGDNAEQTSQLIFGEGFTVFETRDGWSWGQSGFDGYVGYVRRDSLASAPAPAADHQIVALRSFLYPEPRMKRPPLDALPLSAAVTVVGEENGYAALATGGWIYARQRASRDAATADFTATAIRFVGVPYLWGGRTALGIDCSGLIQIALKAARITAPRDTYMQAAELGDPVATPSRPEDYARGDIVFFPGHVGFADGAGGLVHANGHDGMVSVHRLADVIAREKTLRGNDVTVVRRLPRAS